MSTIEHETSDRLSLRCPNYRFEDDLVQYSLLLSPDIAGVTAKSATHDHTRYVVALSASIGRDTLATTRTENVSLRPPAVARLWLCGAG
jgi:hypothetical protein